MQSADAVGRQAQDYDIEHDVRHALAHVHDRVIGRRVADDPVAPYGKYLEQGREEEGYQPGDNDGEHDLDDRREAPDGEDAGVEVEDGELDEGNGEDVEELKRKQ